MITLVSLGLDQYVQIQSHTTLVCVLGCLPESIGSHAVSICRLAPAAGTNIVTVVVARDKTMTECSKLLGTKQIADE